jgi:hypothetical protein
MTDPLPVDIEERVAAQIAVANQVSPDGYWTMKAADGMALLDLIHTLREQVVEDNAEYVKDTEALWKQINDLTAENATLREALREMLKVCRAQHKRKKEWAALVALSERAPGGTPE